MIKHSLMKRILTALFLVISVSLFAQVRDYTSAEISTVHSTNAAAAGDLYNDTQAGILYIGLMDGTLVPIQNTDTQDILQFEFDVSNNKVYIELQNGGLDTIDLTLLNDPGDDNQDLILGTRAGTNQDIDIQRGTGITIDVADNDNDSSNEFQDLSAGTVTATTREVVISDGTNATINIEDADSDASNEFQDLSTGTVTATTREVVISDGTNATINIEDADSDASNELQTISKTGDTVTLSDGGGSFADDHLGTSNQTLNAQRTVILNSNDLIFDGSADDVVIASDGDVGIGTLTPAARLDVDDGTVKFSDYGIGNVLDTLTASAHPHSAFHLGVMPNGDVVEVNTVKSAKIFYPPAIVIDVSTITDGADPDLQIDLYDEYFTRFNTPVLSSPSSAGSIPTYDRSELEYHVTDYDTSVFASVALDDNGNFSYRVIAVPVGGCTFINVVFVVK